MFKTHQKYLFFIALILLPQVGCGASFDCNSKTLTAIDQFICRNAHISTLDERMAKVYAENYKKLSPHNRISYLNSQRDWLKYWPQACLKRKEDKMESIQFLECAEMMYDKRLEILEIHQTKKQWPVFNVAKYSVIKADKSQVPEWVKMVDHSLIYPQIETNALQASDELIANKINAWIVSTSKKMGLKNRISLNENFMDSFLDITLEEVSPDILRLRTLYYFNGFGAHGNSVMNHEHFILSQSRELRESDLLKGKWQNRVAEDVYQKIQIQEPGMVLVDSPKQVIESVSRVQTWDMSKEGFGFQFNPYELTAYAAGAPQVIVEWEKMLPYLTDYAKSQLPLMY
jgi:hypothetical protein